MKSSGWKYLLVGLVLLCARPSHSEIVHGFAGVMDLQMPAPYCVCGYGIDFVTLESIWYPPNLPEMDLSAAANDLTGGGSLAFLLWNGTTGVIVPDSTLEALTTAPPLPYKSNLGQPVLNRVYVVLTGNGLYVKLAVRSFQDHMGMGEIGFEYYVQTDGTPYFGPTVPVKSTTWGLVKALYR